MSGARHDVRLLADDLTGALDAAVRLKRLAGELPVVFDAEIAGRSEGSLAFSAGTRDLPPEEAMRVIGGLTDFWRDGALAFKKIDSLWRGNTVAEIAALARSGRFATILIASAFPEQQRITRGGRPYHRASPHEDWSAIGADPAAALAQHGIVAPVAGAGALPQHPGGVWLFDAQTNADLEAIVRVGENAAKPLLWCGSAGLTGALAAGIPEAMAASDLGGPALAIVGSRHSVSRGQVEELSRREGALTIEVPAEAEAWPRLIARAAATLGSGRPVALWFSPHVALSEEASSRGMSVFFDLVSRSLTPPGAVVATGGDTLLRLCRAAAVQRLLPQREIFPGVPMSKMVGGRWDGISLVSKSGAFGGRGLLAELLATMEK